MIFFFSETNNIVLLFPFFFVFRCVISSQKYWGSEVFLSLNHPWEEPKCMILKGESYYNGWFKSISSTSPILGTFNGLAWLRYHLLEWGSVWDCVGAVVELQADEIWNFWGNIWRLRSLSWIITTVAFFFNALCPIEAFSFGCWFVYFKLAILMEKWFAKFQCRLVPENNIK